MTNTPKTWLWPDRIIGKRESRLLRNEHNAVVNINSDLLAALTEITEAAEAAGWDVDALNAPILNAARAAIAKAKEE